MIKLPDTPAERINIGSALSFAALKTALEQLVGAHGLPMVIEVTEVKPAGFLTDTIEGLVITHATEPRKYSKAVLTQDGSGLSTRLMVYYVGTDKYTRNMRTAEITRRSHAITSGITRMLNASKAQQQEMYYEDMGQIVMQAIDMVQSGAVRPTAPAPAATTARPTTAARSATRQEPTRPEARPAQTARPAAEPVRQSAPAPRPATSTRPSGPAARPAAPTQPARQSAPAAQPQSTPQPTTVPLDQVTGPRTTTVCTCPHCRAKVRITVPQADCEVRVTCGKCHLTFPLVVRRKHS